MKRCALTALAAFVLVAVVQGPLAARDPKMDPAQAHTESGQPPAHWARQTLEGRLALVNAAHNRVGVETENGTSFLFVVNPSTRILVKNHRVTLADFSGYVQSNITVTFLPTRSGNVAAKIEVKD